MCPYRVRLSQIADDRKKPADVTASKGNVKAPENEIGLTVGTGRCITLKRREASESGESRRDDLPQSDTQAFDT